jgi:NhaA family Na+:H+ antiporter
MVVFFFVVGLEIKRELAIGELRDVRAAALPAAAALGGVVVPALIFVALTSGEARAGWGIPMATDIAFAVGVLALLGNRVPAGAKLLLLSVAIVDDIIAITVIALFYTDTVSLSWLAGAAAGLSWLWFCACWESPPSGPTSWSASWCGSRPWSRGCTRPSLGWR